MSTIDTADYKALFVTTAQDHITAIDGLLHRLAQKDDPSTVSQELFRHVHSLKGSSGMMGYKEILAVCDEIDTIIHPGPDTFYLDEQNIPEVTTLVSRLKNLLTPIQKEM